MKECIDTLFLGAGYGKLQSNKEEIVVYYQDQLQFVSVLLLLDLQSGMTLFAETYQHIRRQIKDQFQEKGYDDVHMLTLLLCENTAAGQDIITGDPFAWMLDAGSGKLVVPEGHAEDFYGLRRLIEDSIAPEATAGSEASGKGRSAPARAFPGDGSGSADSLSQKAVVNYAILAVNLILFTICIFTGDRLYDAFMMYPQKVLHGGLYQLVTSMFLHADVDHIFGNLVLLYLLGDIVERRCGHARYAALYLISGIAGNLLSLAYSYARMDYTPSLGASGAIYGVVGAFLWILLQNRGRIEGILLPRALFMIGYSLYLGFVSTNVDNAAHVGGLLTGFLLGILLYKKRERTQEQ